MGLRFPGKEHERGGARLGDRGAKILEGEYAGRRADASIAASCRWRGVADRTVSIMTRGRKWERIFRFAFVLAQIATAGKTAYHRHPNRKRASGTPW